MEQLPLPPLSLQTLITSCRAEQLRQSEDGPACFELLRRALEDHSAEAWAAFDEQFGALLHYWIDQDATQYGFLTLEANEIAEIRSDALARFIDRYGNQLSQHFEHIGAALKVLHKCIRSCVQERQRVRVRNTRLTSALQQASIEQNRGDLSLLAQIELDELRRCIQDQLHQDVPEEHLRLLLDLRFGLDLKPREIHAHAPEQFPSVGYVNDQLDRLFKRLRRRIDIYTQRCL